VAATETSPSHLDLARHGRVLHPWQKIAEILTLGLWPCVIVGGDVIPTSIQGNFVSRGTRRVALPSTDFRCS